MTEQLTEQIISSILIYRRKGVTEYELLERLKADYNEQEIDFELFIELMNTGAFRASFVMKHGKYPSNNLDDDLIIKTAFKMHWIEHKGEDDYLKRFAPKKKKWWHFK
jgi:hypothetical protein